MTCGAAGGRSMTIHAWTGLVEDPGSRPGRSSLDLVRRAEMLALAEFEKPLLISDMCRALAVSQRTLRKAFNKTYNRPPCRHLRMLRLFQVRRALVTSTAQGIPGDAINVGLIGTREDVVSAFHGAGWYPADPITLKSSFEIVGSVLLDRAYKDAPVSPLYFDGRREDLAFEKAV